MKLRALFLNPFVLLAIVAIVAGGGWLWWSRGHQPLPEERYRLQPVDKGDITQTVSANGTLNPVVLVNVGTQVSGTVVKISADFNDHVEAGQVLMELDPSIYQAQAGQSEANVANAKASLELAQANEARMRQLFAKEYVSRQELDQSVQSLKSARAQLALAQAQWRKDKTNLGYTVIRSPVSGVVVSREVDVGQTVAANFQTPTLFKIAQDLRSMQIDSSFAEADIGNIRVGQPVRFTVDAFPGRTFSGSVKQVRLNPTTQQNVVTYDVVVNVGNPEQILLPGMTAYVNITTAERNGVLLVPNAALRFRPSVSGTEPKRGNGKKKDDGDGTTHGVVYRLENGLPTRVPVGLGITDNKFTEITGGGLKEGDKVIVEDQSGAKAEKRNGPPMRMF